MASDNQALLLTLSADIRSLEKQFAKAQGIVDKGSRAMERRAQQASTNLEKFFGKTDPAKALDKIFDSTRFKILDSGVARVGVFGSALESLGVAGLAAAAGVGAVVAAFAGAREAAKFADDINDTADRLHVTTDALQEYRYAIRAAGGEEQGADEALEAFNVTLGKAQAGLPKALKAFKELGFTKEQVKGFGDADTALKAVSERIAGLSSVQQDAVIDQLGLTGLKPLIEGGVASMQRLRDEAHKVGVVMDADLVKRGGDLNDKFETVAQVINVQLKSALVDIGPILLDLLGLMARLAKAAADVVGSFKSVQNRGTDLLKEQRAQALMAANAPFATPDVRKGRLQQVASIDAELARRAAADKPPALPKPTRTLIDQSKTPKAAAGPRDDSAQRQAEVNSQLDDAERDLLQAWSSLIIGADQQAELQKSIVDVEQRILNDKLDKQEADIRADKGISQAKQDQLVASLESVRVQQANVADLRKELIDRERDEKKRAEALKLTENEIDLQTQVLGIQESLATTAKERRDIELRLLDLADQREKADLDAVLASKTAAEADKENARRKLAQLDATKGARQEQVIRNTQGPLEQFVFDNTDAKRSAEQFQSLTVSAFDNLNSGLADLIANGGKAGDVLRNIVRQLLIDVTKQNLQRLEAGALKKLGIGVPDVASTAAATSVGTAITEAGTVAGTSIATQFTTAGEAVAAQITAAMAAGAAGGNGLGSLFSLAGSSGFDFGLGGLKTGGFDFGKALSGWGGGFNLTGFATGTDGAPGGWARINERGPEGLAFLPPGTKVIPNDVLRNLSRLSVAPKAAPGSVSHTFAPTLHVSVMGGPVSASDARRTGAQLGAAAMKQMAKARKAGF